jgi:hypothetical protein
MSDGGIGRGLSYWAAIKISGDLDENGLKDVVARIRAILNGSAPTPTGPKSVDGRIVSAARLTDKGGDPKLTVTYDKNVIDKR